MRRFIELLSLGIAGALIGSLFYMLCLWGVMWRNVRRTSLPVLTVENFNDSWLPALIIMAVAVFASWGAHMYEKSA